MKALTPDRKTFLQNLEKAEGEKEAIVDVARCWGYTRAFDLVAFKFTMGYPVIFLYTGNGLTSAGDLPMQNFELKAHTGGTSKEDLRKMVSEYLDDLDARNLLEYSEQEVEEIVQRYTIALKAGTRKNTLRE